MLRVLKYGTGHEIPKGATYICTQVEEYNPHDDVTDIEYRRFVWHYFVVDCDKNGNPPPTREFPSPDFNKGELPF